MVVMCPYLKSSYFPIILEAKVAYDLTFWVSGNKKRLFAVLYVQLATSLHFTDEGLIRIEFSVGDCKK
jgi:hypothetical protein